MSERTSVERSVLVLGAAPEAGWVSAELAALGYRVEWLVDEGTEAPGAIRGVSAHHGARLTRLDGHVGAFCACLADDGGAETNVEVSAVVVATGNRRVVPWERYGLTPSTPNVLSVPQVRRQLEAPRSTGSALSHRNQTFLIALDLGGETAKETATETLALARDLRRQWHGEVYVFYQNLKVDTANLDELTHRMRDEGVLFCRYERPTVKVDDEGVSFTYVEGTIRGDLLVVPDDVAPAEDTASLAHTLRVRVGEDGFYQEMNIRHYRPGLSERKGIYYAGRCHLDADLTTLRADATRAVSDVDALLGMGYLEPEAIRALVEPARCVRCLTCVRSCPHAAVEIADYAEVTAARVVNLACRGCGTCVANCPVKAIALVGLEVPAWARRDSEGVAAS